MKTAADVLFTPDTLLLIANYLDIPSLFSLRLTSSRLNAIIITHQRLICNSLTSGVFDGGLNLPAYNGPFVSTDMHLRALARVERARLLAPQKLQDLQAEILRARIIHGILIIWTLVDIQREANPGPPFPKYSLSEEASTIASVSHLPSMGLLRQKIVRRLLWRSTPKAEMTSTFITTSEAASSPHQTSRPSSSSDSLDATKRSDIVGQAQQSFVNALNRKARVDLQLAQEHLAEIMPWYNDHPENRAKSWWKEDWALRQGPEFMLAIVSRDKKERAWATEWIEKEWKARPPGARDPVACYTFCFPDPVDSSNQLQTISAEAWKIKSDALFAMKGLHVTDDDIFRRLIDD